ncbi:MAG TPA: SCO family protein [Saprospiraceae bacterium]|nr:SCO family protein [Saprospiraceae bacterium]HMP25433.1 SCO family protein [Saprospiraceae bacterium]
MNKYLFFVSALLLFAACQQPPEPLPIIGERDIINGDTIYHTIPDFAFVNQDSQLVTNETFAGKAYVVDFFFTSCPTICPKTAKQMLRLYERYQDDDRVLLLAHTVDPVRDSVGTLRNYARNLGVESRKWHFVTGNRIELYQIAEDYFSIAKEDPTAPGGFDHSGRFILVDKNRYVRSFCDGTDPESVDQFMKDIDRLLAQEY